MWHKKLLNFKQIGKPKEIESKKGSNWTQIGSAKIKHGITYELRKMEDLGKLSLTIIKASGIKQDHREKVESKETMDKNEG